MNTRLYVGNISYQTTEETLRDLFAADGREVAEVKVVIDRETGQSRGFAFVEMATAEAARAAIEALDGESVDGRQIRVNEAREREQRAGGGPRRGFTPGGRDRD